MEGKQAPPDGNAGAMKKRRAGWNTIGAHLVGLVAVQLILVLGLVGFAAFQDFRDARTEASLNVATVAGLAAEQVASALEEDRSTFDQIPAFAELFASNAVCQLAGPQSQEEWKDDGLFRSQFLLLRPDGSPLCDGAPTSPGVTEEQWFKQAASTTEPVETGPLTDPETGDPYYVFAAAIPQYGTILAIKVDLTSVGTMLDTLFGTIAPAPSFVLTSSDRSTELGSTGDVGGRDLGGTPFSAPIRTGSNTFDDLDGTARIYGAAEVPELGWHLYAGISTQDAFAAARKSLRERMVFAGVLVFVVLSAAMVVSRRFARPIRSLARVTRKVAGGDLTSKVNPAGPSELQELGEAYNEMLEVRKSAEAALRKAYRAERKAADELREIDEMRTAFLRAISHELRTPLTSVVGYSTFLSEAMDDLPEEEVRQSIEAIANQSRRLERLLLDLLDVERLERGIVEPHLVDTDVSQLVMRVIDNANGSGRIRADVKGKVKANIDPALVERIVENLVFNAVKHTPDDAKIWVRARRANGHLRLSVEDSGDGVPDELKTAIFEPFKQGDVPAHSPGTGVGLNLVAQFAKLHGGRAWVEDRKGGGSSFRIELPATAGPRAKRPRKPDPTRGSKPFAVSRSS